MLPLREGLMLCIAQRLVALPSGRGLVLSIWKGLMLCLAAEAWLLSSEEKGLVASLSGRLIALHFSRGL
jgi:hypothetical protein